MEREQKQDKYHNKKFKEDFADGEDPSSLLVRQDGDSFSTSYSSECDSQERLISSLDRKEGSSSWNPMKRKKTKSVESLGLLCSRDEEKVRGFDLEEIIVTGEMKTDLQEKNSEIQELPIWMMQCSQEILEESRVYEKSDDYSEGSDWSPSLEYEPPPSPPPACGEPTARRVSPGPPPIVGPPLRGRLFRHELSRTGVLSRSLPVARPSMWPRSWI